MQDKKIAFVFPGQGSQAVGMLSTLADEPIVRETLKEADEALGFALSKLIAEGPAEELSLTVNTQPALVCASIAMYRFYLQEGGRKPDLLAGHSLGEYSALVAAGATLRMLCSWFAIAQNKCRPRFPSVKVRWLRSSVYPTTK